MGLNAALRKQRKNRQILNDPNTHATSPSLHVQQGGKGTVALKSKYQRKGVL